MNLSKYLFTILLFANLSIADDESKLVNFSKVTTADSVLLKDYKRLHKKFFKKACRPGEEPKYDKLLRSYRGNGIYIPQLSDQIDIESIEMHLPLLVEKRKWTVAKYKELKKVKRWPYAKVILNNLRVSLDKLLDYKKKYQLKILKEQKEQYLEKSKRELALFKKYYQQLIQQIPFLLGFKFPVDHLLNRQRYDDLKKFDDLKSKKLANQAFFYRRVLEDGALDPNNSRPDKYLRSTLDTVTLKLEKNNDFINEEIRYDFGYLFYRITREIKRGKRQHLKRFKAWQKRVTKIILFYRKLIKNHKSGNQKRNEKILSVKLAANNKLKDFVLEKKKLTYNFWHKQSPINKALFAVETILFNEVGTVDGRDALERMDVVKVVMNRVSDPEYNFMPKDQDLYKYLLRSMTDKEMQSDRWMNVLFKRGEFSFTYFYISGVAKIFCPDMTRSGRYLRKKNLKLSLNILKKSKYDFDGVRYFSRASMNGRIDMSTVWSNFTALNERPGNLADSQKYLRRLFLSGQYKYFYQFTDDKSFNFDVIEIKDNVYAMRYIKGKSVFYKYRNPNHFRYFKVKPSN